MKKRTALGVVTAVALLPGCSSPSVSTQMGLHAQMESGPAINSTNGRYRAGTADIALTKIVSLPDDQLGVPVRHLGSVAAWRMLFVLPASGSRRTDRRPIE
jgi:hypothetical protein